MAAIDGDWIRWIGGGIAAGGLAIGGGIFGAIGKVRSDAKKDVEKARAEAEDGDRALWAAYNTMNSADGQHRLEAEQRYATQEDVKAMGDRLEKRMDAHEARASAAMSLGLHQIEAMIRNRPAVKE